MSDKKITLRKLEQFFKSKDFVINRIFHDGKKVLFMTIKNDNLHEDVLVNFDEKFTIYFEDIDIKANIIEVRKGSSTVPINEEHSLSSKGLDELSSSELVDDGQRIKEGLTMTNYKSISISTESADATTKQYLSQLEKFKECVKNLKYKFGILSFNCVYLIQRNNNVVYYNIRDKNAYLPLERINFIISIDIENIFESIDTFVEDVMKVYKNFYNILSDAHRKQILALECQISTLTNVPLLLKEKNKKLIETSECIEQTSQMLTLICNNEIKTKKMLTDNEDVICKNPKDERMKEQTRDRLYNELDKIRVKKDKAQKLLVSLKNMYNHDLICFDYNIFKSVHLFEHFAEKVKNVL